MPPAASPAPEKHNVTCPVCRKKVPLAADARCEACSSLLVSPRLLPEPRAGGSRVLRTLVELIGSQRLARFLAARAPGPISLLVGAFGLSVAALAVVALGPGLLLQWAMGWPAWMGGDVLPLALAFTLGPLVGLALMAHLLRNAAVLIKRSSLPSLPEAASGLLPLVEARFQLMGFRGRRALVVYVTFRVELLEPDSRVGLFVRLETEEGKPLGARLPRYRAPDGEFLLRELGAPVGRPSDGLFCMGALIPLTVVVLPGAAEQTVRLVARIELRLDERVETTQSLTAEVVTAASDYPAPPTPRAAPGVAAEDSGSASMEIVAVSLQTDGGCPVCGEGLLGPVPRCTQCDVPHHPECWAFAGRCSTYACEGEPRMAE